MMGLTRLALVRFGGWLLGVLMVLGLISYTAYQWGYQVAKLNVEIMQNQVLNAQITKLTQETQAAQAVSLALSQSIDQYKQLGEQTTDELHKLLAQTRATRQHCRFDAASLRILHNARERAAQAVTGGIDHPVSETRNNKR
ncbi:hypothetical protein ROV31_06085 [Pasteurella multocida]|uniref:hypothetical protein n=1 Tax=Pasteurella multocida TaxID=747 RepID=UPI002C64DDCD|nr:hypothetical protein [Pasteurella multocida]MEB3470143.1 hypothetical protein [Pasteurella multocida]